MSTEILIGPGGIAEADIPAVYLWGMDVVRAVQMWENPVIDALMKFFTVLGAETGYLLILPLVYWCVNEKKGMRLGLILMCSTWINLFFKNLFHAPRPFQFDASLGREGWLESTTYGFPSGHAQNSLVFWTTLASQIRKRFFAQALVAALLISLCTGLSRLYLGVHFPTDLFGGWGIGALIIVAYILLEGRVSNLLDKGGLRVQIIAAAAVSLLMIIVSNEGFISGGVILGMGAGYALMKKYIRFQAAIQDGENAPHSGKVWKKFLILLLRYLVGLAGSALIFLVLRNFLPARNSEYFRLAFFTLLFVLELWIYAGAPWVFIKLKLAQIAAPSASAA